MSAIVDRKTIITTKDGTQFQCEASDKIENRTQCQVICDGPKCDTRHDAEARVSFEFCQEDVAASLDAYPEVGDSFISVVLPPRSPSFGNGQPLAFCGRECLRDYFQYKYVAPPPRPVQKPDTSSVANPALVANSIDALAEKITPSNMPDRAFYGLSTLPSAEDLDAATSQPSIPGVTAAVSDATGYVEEQ